jgi:hypothetical protein
VRSRAPLDPTAATTAAVVRQLEASAAATIVPLDGGGLFVVEIGPVPGPSTMIGTVALPLIQLARLPGPGASDIDILAESGAGEAWLGANGGVVAVRAPQGGGAVVVTAFGAPGPQIAMPAIRVRRLGGENAAGPPQPSATARDGIQVEILLHVEQSGDCRFAAGGWVGPRGQRLRIEGFALMPLQGLGPGDIEYKAFQPSGSETPWTAAPAFCGTRARRLPLTGFAVRPAPHIAARWDIVYSGAFFDAGRIGPCRNGEPCRSTLRDDPLEAMTISITPTRAG